MSLISIGMNLLLAGLLVAAMVVGLRLNKRLKALRDSHEGFEAAVVHLNMAAQRAEQGLADLRAATDEATEVLSDRIEKGRALAAKLEKLVSSAPELPRAPASLTQPVQAERPPSRGLPPVSPPARSSAGEDRLAALLAMARSRLQEKEAAQAAAEERPAPQRPAPQRAAPEWATPPAPPVSRLIAEEPLVGRAPLPGRRLAAFDDDLFEDTPLTLDHRLTGGPR